MNQPASTNLQPSAGQPNHSEHRTYLSKFKGFNNRHERIHWMKITTSRHDDDDDGDFCWRRLQSRKGFFLLFPCTKERRKEHV
ncbi:coenzyme PQQ synthesis protein [Anopheles sinensis]|uniref:Coenzyme PQQ synthesis protein n=1 Tax=Anopheles sinensis TaxID=74873 RepID=A0A084WU04_ANOSI|nr:coenzyme PQQ synthesis protein [Anopheles sinensis]